MKKFVALWAVIAVVMLVAVVPARAEVLTYHDQFNIELGPSGEVVNGGGSGFDGDGDLIGDWYTYPTGWINQWFYNGPFDPFRWKRIWGTINVDPTAPEYGVDIVINWATPEWQDPPPPEEPPVCPPLPCDIQDIDEELMYIGRMQLTDFEYFEPGSEPFDFYEEILEYNPEWISIDVMGYNVAIIGEIYHECVPEPATLSLLALGGLAVLARRRKS